MDIREVFSRISEAVYVKGKKSQSPWLHCSIRPGYKIRFVVLFTHNAKFHSTINHSAVLTFPSILLYLILLGKSTFSPTPKSTLLQTLFYSNFCVHISDFGSSGITGFLCINMCHCPWEKMAFISKRVAVMSEGPQINCFYMKNTSCTISLHVYT